MYDNKTAMAEATKFILEQPIRERGYPIEEIIPAIEWLGHRLDYELDFGVGDQAQQLEWFNFLLEIGRSKRIGGTQSLGRFMLTGWATKTANLYGRAYHEGHFDGHITGSFFATERAKLKAKKASVASKVRLSTAGMNGALVRRNRYEPIKLWALKEASNMRGADRQIARRLSACLPKHLADISDDPVRLIYDTLRAKRP